MSPCCAPFGLPPLSFGPDVGPFLVFMPSVANSSERTFAPLSVLSGSPLGQFPWSWLWLTVSSVFRGIIRDLSPSQSRTSSALQIVPLTVQYKANYVRPYYFFVDSRHHRSANNWEYIIITDSLTDCLVSILISLPFVHFGRPLHV